MGHDHQQTSSSGTLVAVIGVGLVLAILAIIVVAAVGLFWVRTSRVETMVARERVVAELHRAGAEAQRADAMDQLEQARTAATPDPRLTFGLEVDPDGNISVDGEKIEQDELRTRLVQLKDETSNAFSVHINADPECPVKHVVAIVAVCDDVGDIDYRIVASKESEVSADQSEPEK